MPSPASAAEFLDLVRKSGVLDEKRLDAHVDKLRAAKTLPSEAGKLAGVLVRDGLLTHFQAEQIMLGKWRRFTIGKYKVLERLGSGGMGSVFLCEHKLMRRRVAVKVLPTAKATDPSALERFYREARAVAALDHPNIVHAYDIDQDADLHFLVMEYVDGASLQEIIKKVGPMDPVRAAHYIYQSCLGLQHAHTAGLVHRDIKPGNVLVDRTGVVKILDMGLARFFNDEEDILTKKYDENVLGTADYLAPEQALDSHGVDIRADIYSLGATFYYVLTGRTPFSEGTVAQKLIWHQTRQPKAIRSLRPEVPEGLVAIIDKMMAKDPAQRYQTPLEVAEALVPFIQKPIGPPPEAEMPRLSLAATGVAPGEATQVSSGSTGTQSPTPRKNWQVPPSGTKPASKPPDTRGQAAPPAAPPARAPAAAVTTGTASGMQPTVVSRPNGKPAAAPTRDDDSIPWERLASDTDDPTARADTAPRSSRKNLSSSRSRLAGRSGVHAAQDRRRLLLVVAVVSVAVLASLAFLYWKFIVNQQPKTHPGRPPLRVNKAGPPGEFKTIQEALSKAVRGDRIVVAPGEYAEALLVQKKRGITLEAGDGEVVIVPRPGHDPRDPLLKAEDVKGVRIKGLRFKGRGKVQRLVLVMGNDPGLTLERLQLDGFTQTAVEIANCAGTADEPVRLRAIETIPAEPSSPPPAVTFVANPQILPKINAYVHIDQCRFQGDYKAGKPVKFEKAQLGPDVTLDGNPLGEAR